MSDSGYLAFTAVFGVIFLMCVVGLILDWFRPNQKLTEWELEEEVMETAKPGLEEIEIEGVLVLVDPSAEIKPGDLYIARRNRPWRLLTCDRVNLKEDYIIPKERAYLFDTCNCKKVVAIDGETVLT